MRSRVNLVRRLIDGLLMECKLLSAEAARLKDEREFAATEGKTVDITDLWLEYLQMLISAKMNLICKLTGSQAQPVNEFRSSCQSRRAPQSSHMGTDPPVAE